MPIDTHSYLIAQGWEGKGSGLRKGAISRPLAVPQKRNLAGVGKDRDEAFPFWDHLFSAASKTIQIKTYESDEASDNENDSTTAPQPTIEFHRTTTGILSNRRPISGTPASTSASGSGSATPIPSSTTDTPSDSRSQSISSAASQLSLLTIAKREAAKRALYSRFFRGPVLGPGEGFDENEELATTNTASALTDDIADLKGNSSSGLGFKSKSGSESEKSSAKTQKNKKSSSNTENVIKGAESRSGALSVEEIISTHLPGHRVSKKRKKGESAEERAERKKKKEKSKRMKKEKAKDKEGDDEESEESSSRTPSDSKGSKEKRKRKEEKRLKDEEKTTEASAGDTLEETKPKKRKRTKDT